MFWGLLRGQTEIHFSSSVSNFEDPWSVRPFCSSLPVHIRHPPPNAPGSVSEAGTNPTLRRDFQNHLLVTHLCHLAPSARHSWSFTLRLSPGTISQPLNLRLLATRLWFLILSLNSNSPDQLFPSSFLVLLSTVLQSARILLHNVKTTYNIIQNVRETQKRIPRSRRVE